MCPPPSVQILSFVYMLMFLKVAMSGLGAPCGVGAPFGNLVEFYHFYSGHNQINKRTSVHNTEYVSLFQ